MTTDFSSETASRAQVVERIIDLIVWGKLSIGERTSEKAISELLGYESRRPIVREALALLVRDGIVAQRPQWGQLVPPVSVDEAKRSLRLRAGIERVVVEHLASQGESNAVYTLEYKLRELEEAANETGGDDFLKKNAWYRSERARVAGFLTGAWTIRIWSDQIRIFRSEANQEILLGQKTLSEPIPVTPDEVRNLVEGHRTVLESIKEQDDEGAAAAIEEQLEEALRWLEEAQFARIENELISHEAVAEATVVEIEDEYGIEDKYRIIEGEYRGQALIAFVVLNQECRDGLEDELRWHVSESTAGKISPPDLVFVVDELPKAQSRKIVRHLLRNIAKRLLQNIAEGMELRKVRALANQRVRKAIEKIIEAEWILEDRRRW